MSWLTDAPSLEEGRTGKPKKAAKPVKNPVPPPTPIPEEPKSVRFSLFRKTLIFRRIHWIGTTYVFESA